MGGGVSARDDHSRPLHPRAAGRAAPRKDESRMTTTTFEPTRSSRQFEVRTMNDATTTAKIHVQNFDFYYGTAKTLHGISLDVPERQVTALIGPSGCGKSTFLRSINRMNELLPGTRHSGDILLEGISVFSR